MTVHGYRRAYRSGRDRPGPPAGARHRRQLRELAAGDGRPGPPPHRHRPRPAGARRAGQAPPTTRWRPTPTACGTCSTCSASTPPPWSATRWAAAWPRSSPTSTPSAASAWCSWPAGEPAADVTPLLRLAAAPLAEVFLPPLRWPVAQPLVRTAPGGARPAGQRPGPRPRARVPHPRPACPTARPRSVHPHAAVGGRLAGPGGHPARPLLPGRAVPALMVWGDRDGVIPVAHAARTRGAARAAGSRSSPAPATSPTTTTPTASWP